MILLSKRSSVDSNGSPNTGLIIGCMAAVPLIAALCLFVYFHRRSVLRARKEEAKQDSLVESGRLKVDEKKQKHINISPVPGLKYNPLDVRHWKRHPAKSQDGDPVEKSGPVAMTVKRRSSLSDFLDEDEEKICTNISPFVDTFAASDSVYSLNSIGRADDSNYVTAALAMKSAINLSHLNENAESSKIRLTRTMSSYVVGPRSNSFPLDYSPQKNVATSLPQTRTSTMKELDPPLHMCFQGSKLDDKSSTRPLPPSFDSTSPDQDGIESVPQVEIPSKDSCSSIHEISHNGGDDNEVNMRVDDQESIYSVSSFARSELSYTKDDEKVLDICENDSGDTTIQAEKESDIPLDLDEVNNIPQNQDEASDIFQNPDEVDDISQDQYDASDKSDVSQDQDEAKDKSITSSIEMESMTTSTTLDTKSASNAPTKHDILEIYSDEPILDDTKLNRNSLNNGDNNVRPVSSKIALKPLKIVTADKENMIPLPMNDDDSIYDQYSAPSAYVPQQYGYYNENFKPQFPMYSPAEISSQPGFYQLNPQARRSTPLLTRPLSNLPAPNVLRESGSMIDFAPKQRRITSGSTPDTGFYVPYSGTTSPAPVLYSSFDVLPDLPSASSLRHSREFSPIDFASRSRYASVGAAASDKGSDIASIRGAGRSGYGTNGPLIDKVQVDLVPPAHMSRQVLHPLW